MNDLRSGSQLQPNRPKARIGAWVASFIFLLITSTATAYFQVFGAMKPFDDEGGLITLLRRFMQGGSLYNSVATIYGPAFFLYQWLAHLLLGELPSNDSARFVSLTFWILTALLAFILVRRATNSWILALIAHALVFQLAKVLGEEPAHPQELCLLLVLAMLAIGDSRWPRAARSSCLGGIAAAMVLTKINAGALILVILALALTFSARVSRSIRVLRSLCVLGSILFIALLMWPNLGAGWAQRFLILGECSLGGVLIVLWGTESDDGLEFRDFMLATAGFVVAAGGITLFAIAHGASVGAMFHWLVIVPRQVIGGTAWYLFLQMPNTYMVCAATGLLCAFLARTRLATPARIAILKLGVGMVVLVLAGTYRVGALLCLTAPWVWLLAVPGLPETRGRISPLGRQLGSLTASIFILYAFPVAGGQVRIGGVPLAIAGMLLLGEGLDYVKSIWPAGAASFPRTVAAVALVAALAIPVFWTVRERNTFAKLEPLNLRSATRLRLPPEEARGLREITTLAQSSCEVLGTAPGMPSFNLWTGLPPVAALGAGNWVTGLPDSTQSEVVRDIDSKPRLCFIYNEEVIHFWAHTHDVGDRPVIRYMRQNFRPVLQRGANVLMERNVVDTPD
ncbi:MAG: hypothetical protein ABI806_02720 [Candidatus Solibacter sp.]